MNISILVPTRGRPEQFQAMYCSLMSLAEMPGQIEIVAYLDDDEPHEGKYLAQQDVAFVRGSRIVFSEMWNECWRKANGPIFMQAGDDLAFRTQGWDTLIRDTFTRFPDRILFVHGSDGYQNEAMGTHGFLHKNWT